MTFSRMNNKSRNIHTTCAASTPGNLSNNKFLKDYYNLVKHHLDEHLPKKIPTFPTVDELRSRAEQEFVNYYGLYPTCAVFAPGCFTIAGKSANLVESKSLSMAIQLVTLVVGKRRHGSKWCQVKMFLDKNAGETFELRLNNENLRIQAEETSWIRYLKGTIQSFKNRRAYIPGFQIVIVSSLPAKRFLGSSSALVVALYTFLEAITNTHAESIIEKTLICYIAEELAAGSRKVRISDILTSIIGNESQIFAINARSLHIDRYHWNAIDVEFILIELPNVKKKSLVRYTNNESCYKEIMTVVNTMSRWRTHPIGISMMEFLFSQRTMQMANDIIDRDRRIVEMTDAIRKEQWNVLGKLLWENHRSACKYLDFLSDDIKRIESMFKTIEGILGASIINDGTSIVTLVQKSKLKTFIAFLNYMKMSQQYYLMKACTGTSIIYTYERPLNLHNIKYLSQPKLIIKNYLREKNVEENYYKKYKIQKFIDTVSLFVPRKS